MFSLPQLCWGVLTRGVLALTIWSGFSVSQNGGEKSPPVTSAYDLRGIKNLKSVTITISASEYAFFCCYYYSLSIHGDGRIEYYGHLGSFVPGLHRSRLSEAEILRLLDAFRAAGFYSLQDESNLLVMDAPSISIELSADGYSKTVTDRLGESKAFGALMDRILEISHAQRWLQKTPDTLQAVLADTENLNTADDDGRTVLMWDCQSRDVAAVRELIRSGDDGRAKSDQGTAVVVDAAASQSPEMIDALL